MVVPLTEKENIGEEAGLGKSVGLFKISSREPLGRHQHIEIKGSFKIGLEESARVGKKN